MPSASYIVNSSWMNELGSLLFVLYYIIGIGWDRVKSNSLSFGMDNKENFNEIHSAGKFGSGLALGGKTVIYSGTCLIWDIPGTFKRKISYTMETCFSRHCGFFSLSTLPVSHYVEATILSGLTSAQVVSYLCYSHSFLPGIWELRSKSIGTQHSVTIGTGSGMSMGPNPMQGDMRRSFLKTYGKSLLALRAVIRDVPSLLLTTKEDAHRPNCYCRLFHAQPKKSHAGDKANVQTANQKIERIWFPDYLMNGSVNKLWSPRSLLFLVIDPTNLLIGYLQLDYRFLFLFLAENFLTDTHEGKSVATHSKNEWK